MDAVSLKAAIAEIRPEELVARTIRLLGRQGPRRPLIRVIEIAGESVVVKDLSTLGPWARPTLGRFLASREQHIYRRLEGVPGIPTFYGMVGPLALAIEYIEGTPLRAKVAEKLTEDFFRPLTALVAAIHARGVAHLDLRYRQNVLIDGTGAPWIVDFGTAIRTDRLGPLARFPHAIDRAAALKWKARHFPATLTASEARLTRRADFFASLWPFRSSTTKRRSSQ